MDPIHIMLNGLPGNVATIIARHILAADGFELLPVALTGPEITDTEQDIDGYRVALVRPENRDDALSRARTRTPQWISVDFTHPTAVVDNARFYCDNNLPFVMGTTGGDRRQLIDTVEQSPNAAVIAPNMAKQIVGFQAMMEYAADTFPGLFRGYRLQVRESHQQGKADTSGTAKAVVNCFNRLGVDFSVGDIVMERDPAAQREKWGIPDQYLGGHGWHTYTLVSEDGTVTFEFTHNINGRDVYAGGTMDAAAYLTRKIREGAGGCVFSMIDVLMDR